MRSQFSFDSPQHWLSEAHGGGGAHVLLAGGSSENMKKSLVSGGTLPGNSSHGTGRQQETLRSQRHSPIRWKNVPAHGLQWDVGPGPSAGRPWEEPGDKKVTVS